MFWLVTFLVFALLPNLPYVQADTCTTPNNEAAECTPLDSCPLLAKVSHDPAYKDFIQQSNCGETWYLSMVCCGSASNFTNRPTHPITPIVKKLTKDASVIASKEICGYQHADDYFHTSNGTVISEFPWLALLEYRHRNDSNVFPPEGKYQCSGSVINNKYILTAGQCLTHSTYIVVAVRLGDYNINNETDCMLDKHQYECADEAQDYGIEKIIPHPEYKFSQLYNDIGLIRVKGKIWYTDYIRPICLPLWGKKKPKIGATLITSGWGKTDHYESEYVEIKKVTFNTLITNEECSETLYNLTKREEIPPSERVICGKPRDTNDRICYGDAGGPVMYRRKSQWYQVAIVSFGTTTVCNQTHPEVFTKIEYYLEWIKETVMP